MKILNPRALILSQGKYGVKRQPAAGRRRGCERKGTEDKSPPPPRSLPPAFQRNCGLHGMFIKYRRCWFARSSFPPYSSLVLPDGPKFSVRCKPRGTSINRASVRRPTYRVFGDRSGVESRLTGEIRREDEEAVLVSLI